MTGEPCRTCGRVDDVAQPSRVVVGMLTDPDGWPLPDPATLGTDVAGQHVELRLSRGVVGTSGSLAQAFTTALAIALVRGCASVHVVGSHPTVRDRLAIVLAAALDAPPVAGEPSAPAIVTIALPAGRGTLAIARPYSDVRGP